MTYKWEAPREQATLTMCAPDNAMVLRDEAVDKIEAVGDRAIVFSGSRQEWLYCQAEAPLELAEDARSRPTIV